MQMQRSKERQVPPVRLYCKDKSRTVQSAMKECDINRILSKYQETGLITHGAAGTASYEDFVNVPDDYHAAMDQILNAQEKFMTLPSSVRAKFHNDPAEFLQNVGLPENRKFLQEMGLINPDPPGPAVEPGASQSGEAQAPTPPAEPAPGEPRSDVAT